MIGEDLFDEVVRHRCPCLLAVSVEFLLHDPLNLVLELGFDAAKQEVPEALLESIAKDLLERIFHDGWQDFFDDVLQRGGVECRCPCADRLRRRRGRWRTDW